MTNSRDSRSWSHGGNSNRESRLTEVVAEYVNLLNDGERIAPEHILVAYPDLGPNILRQRADRHRRQYRDVQLPVPRRRGSGSSRARGVR